MTDPPAGKYLFEYEHNGHWWALTIPAQSEEEAADRVKKMGNAIYKGRIGASITVPVIIAPPVGILVRLITWWKNYRKK